MPFEGTFISFEGGEGSGKSTQVAKLSQYLRNRGQEVIVVRNPGSTDIGEKIRGILLDTENRNLQGKTEVFLHAAAIHQGLKTFIIPALETGKIVICDRYVDSSLAYQGYARGVGVDFVRSTFMITLQWGSIQI